jgi:hypothetical protein
MFRQQEQLDKIKQQFTAESGLCKELEVLVMFWLACSSLASYF